MMGTSSVEERWERREEEEACLGTGLLMEDG